MPVFEKLPVLIEAQQWNGTATGATTIISWILNNGGTARYYAPGEWDPEWPNATYIVIDTLEGSILASPHDWVIQGIQGEFYPCKPDILNGTYREVTDGAVCLDFHTQIQPKRVRE
jgi:hypothetical protein